MNNYNNYFFTMRIGWRTFLKQKFQPKSPFYALGIAVAEETATFSVLKAGEGGLFVHAEETVSANRWTKHLPKWVSQQGLQGTPTYLAFCSPVYQSLQIDRPAVEEQELKATLNWSVKELMGSEQEQVFDFIDLPVPLAGNKKVTLLAMPKMLVQEASETIFSAGLNLQSISVEELVLCDLLPAQAEPIMLLVQEGQEEVSLIIVKDGHQYVNRRLKGFENLGSFSPEELQMGLLDSLSIQVQRSMDYFESQLRQAPVRKVMLHLHTSHSEVVIQQLRQVVSADISLLLPDVQVNDPLNVRFINFISLGAALGKLRDNERQLAKEQVA